MAALRLFDLKHTGEDQDKIRLHPESNIGEILILVADKRDLGTDTGASQTAA